MKTLRRVSGIIVLLILVGALTGCVPTDIKKINDDPLSYHDRFVMVRGVVDSLIPFPLTDKGLFEIRDDTGSIWVYTELGLPEKGRTITVTAEVKTSASFGGHSFGVVLVERAEDKRQ
jgi:hypothetical protein